MSGRRAKAIKREILMTMPRHIQFDPAVLARRYRTAKARYKQARRFPN
jgi:hypothetical protein